MMRFLTVLLLAAAASCASRKETVGDALLNAQPRSILVLPPLNSTVEVGASASALASVTVPLAEAGYYVFPVALVNAIMRENGLPSPGEMHSVPVAKLNEIFAPDAILYLTVSEWGTSFELLNSRTQVAIEGRLIDAGTGAKLWGGRRSLSRNSNGGQSSLIGMLAGAVVSQVVNSANDPSPALARQVNYDLLTGENNGWILGPYNPDSVAQLEAIRRRKAEAAGRQ